MRIGFIGAGNVAQTFGRHLVNAGYEVLLSSRNPEAIKLIVGDLGPLARVATIAEAADAEIVILGVPWVQVSTVLKNLPVWHGQILIDATNHFQTFAPDFLRADLRGEISSQIVADSAPGAKVIKALNTVPMEWMSVVPANGKMVWFLSGDDLTAKDTVSALFKRLNFIPVDLGNLKYGGKLQQLDGPLTGVQFEKIRAL